MASNGTILYQEEGGPVCYHPPEIFLKIRHRLARNSLTMTIEAAYDELVLKDFKILIDYKIVKGTFIKNLEKLPLWCQKHNFTDVYANRKTDIN